MLLSEICGLVSGERPLGREDGSAIRSVITQMHRDTTAVILVTDLVRSLQETRYVSATEPNRLKLFGERLLFLYENHT
jgi:hypothetical protein